MPYKIRITYTFLSIFIGSFLALPTLSLATLSSNNPQQAATLSGTKILKNKAGILFGNEVSRDPSLALRRYQYLYERGDFNAALNLGLLYLNGKGIRKNIAKGVAYFIIAAKANVVEAHDILGTLYFTGKFVEKDNNKAFYHFQKAADLNNAHSQYMLYTMYSAGVGTEQDSAKAEHYLIKAADQGLVDAQFYLGRWYDHGLCCDPDYKKVFYYYDLAA